jgi:ABC-type multidrug transport system ATPase subunit
MTAANTHAKDAAGPKLGVTITAEKLAKRFNREWIFRNFDFVFKPGERIAVTGPNGSGKSTLLHVLCGHLPQSQGSLVYADSKVIEADAIFTKISFAAPYMELIDEFTLEEQIRFHFKLKRGRNNLQTSELLQIMQLENAANKFIGNFSSGMKQRVKLALAFYTDSDVIFLDEPATNLDQKAFDWYLNQLRQLPAQSLTIIASNNPAEYPESNKILNIEDFKA